MMSEEIGMQEYRIFLGIWNTAVTSIERLGQELLGLPHLA
jgi:hypothetical protein